MTREDIISKVKALNLPKDSYIVFGSCPLAVLGIREANDIDLLVTEEVLQQLRSSGWQQIQKGPRDCPLVFDIFEAHDSWEFSSYKPTLTDLQKSAMEIDGVPFAAIEEVRNWKLASGRLKDKEDLQLIRLYLQNNSK